MRKNIMQKRYRNYSMFSMTTVGDFVNPKATKTDFDEFSKSIDQMREDFAYSIISGDKTYPMTILKKKKNKFIERLVNIRGFTDWFCEDKKKLIQSKINEYNNFILKINDQNVRHELYIHCTFEDIWENKIDISKL